MFALSDPNDHDAQQQELKFSCTHKVEFFCDTCQAFYCNDHCDFVHSIEGLEGHARIIIENFNESAKALDHEQPKPTTDKQTEFLTDWKSNNLLFVSPHSQVMEKGLKWINTGLSETDPFLLASFAGPTGAGKSMLVRYLAEGEHIPVSSNSQTDAASSDINCYNGRLPKDNSKFLIFDSEGKGAEVINQTIKHTQSCIDPDQLSYRRRFIDTCYPRLLYLFSDVFIYVYNQSAQNSVDVISHLLSYAEDSSVSTINQPTKPHLIVVYNKATNITSYDVTEASNKIFPPDSDNKELVELRGHYKTLNAIFIPPGKSFHPGTDVVQFQDLDQFSKQMIKFKYLVHRLLESACLVKTNKTLYNRSHMMGYMSKAINILNVKALGTIDIYHMTKSMEGVTSFIYEFFKCIYNQNICKKMTPVSAFDNAYKAIQERTGDIIYLYCKRNQILSPVRGQTLPESLNKVFQEAYDKIMDSMPCDSVHPKISDLRCETVRSCHTQEINHKSTQTVKKQRRFLMFNLGETISFTNEKWYSSGHVPFGDYKTLAAYASDNLPTYLLDDNQVTQNRRPLLLNKDLAPSNNVCFGCLLAHPTQPRKCGHMFCSDCCEESPIKCPICDTDSPWINSQVPKYANTRVLSIEGIGGVRGIAQAIAINHLEHLLYDIPISRLVDLIVGSGSGGLVALGISGSDGKSSRMIEFYNDLNKVQIYPFGGVPIVKNVTKFICRAIYKRDSFNNVLSKHLPENNKKYLLQVQASTPGSAHVAVTAATNFDGSNKLTLFSSYHLPRKACLKYDVLNTSIFNAALATSATPGFIDSHTINGITYTDGSSLALSPCHIALHEADRLFQRPCDLFITITTGKWNNTQTQKQNDIITVGDKTVDAFTESKTQWKSFNTHLKETNSKTLPYRINPRFKNGYEYEENWRTEEIVKEASDFYGITNLGELSNIANHLLASQFYLDAIVTSLNGSITFTIKCRLSPTDYERRALSGLLSTTPFQVSGIGFDQQAVFHEAQLQPSFSQQFTINNLDRHTWKHIDIKCKLYVGSGTTNGQYFSISGSPLSFEKIFE
ncbi:patatin family protein [Cavenderia fasciculata]|uniref:Patatin family protein n=1 Tax=Cavenderia fasciculata TaxID=261658 RepID=F4PM46_CACFS|nr:patatin family protein [Cavenderia fasciculata]EGG22749.1 patatin family protein [Cavenderia fasciculata]|eukprot:XP_004360600.1 patatin family protein [Cavenderia fasciculata]